MHSGEKAHLDKALENFIQLDNIYVSQLEMNFKSNLAIIYFIYIKKKDNVGVLRGMAECFLLLKQVPKARNYLKRASTLSWNSEDAEDLEKCWLLLASTFIAVKNFVWISH